MTWRLRYSAKADRQLAKLDRNTSRIIVAWLNKNIDGCSDPRSFGKALSANHAGKWRYRMGNWRVLVEIADKELIVLALEVGHRSRVYQ
ncbi:MAG: type II toxin-antitoxin system RelE/ParE family toxin [Coriobacteriales bacterium]|jgi:mRNA interferase RelE/StbE|nr:type II toxin-antitoxin system RelE/ParE family toxin [Coriobacteriales bacterium]